MNIMDDQSSTSNHFGSIEERSQSQVQPLHKVSQRQWDAAQRAIGVVQEHQVPKEIRRLQQCRATRTSRQLIFTTAGTAVGSGALPRDYERIIQQATETEECDSAKEKEILTKSVSSFLESFGRFSCPTVDDDTVLAFPARPSITPDASKELGHDLQNDEKLNGTDDSSADESEEDDYDSDEADALFLDKKAVERVMELRLKTRLASESVAAKRAALSGIVCNLHSLEQEVMVENDANDINNDISDETVAAELSPPSAIAKPKPKNLFAILGAEDTTYDGSGCDLSAGPANVEPQSEEIEDKELQLMIKNMKASLLRKKDLLQKIERALPGAVENMYNTNKVVKAHIQKTAVGQGPSNSIEKTLFSPDRKKRSKPTIKTGALASKKHKLITPECRFLAYLQGV
jgi:hypothetical protein